MVVAICIWKILQTYGVRKCKKRKIRELDAIDHILKKCQVEYFHLAKYPLKEVMTFPRGPSESGPMWYAQARLACTIWGCRVWGAATNGEVHYRVFMSRVMDRTGVFSVALLDELLTLYDWTTTKDLVIWSDVGTHFRNYEVLGTAACKYTEQLKCNVHYNYGPEACYTSLRVRLLRFTIPKCPI